MKITRTTDPRIICEKWARKIEFADQLSKTIQEGALKGRSISSSVEKLEKVRKKLKVIYHVVVEKARYETTFWPRVRRFCYLGGGTVIDGALQVVTAALWSRVLNKEEPDSQDSIVIAGATLGSLVTTAIKNKMYSSNRKYFKAIAEMEGIIPSKGMLKHYKLVITKYKSDVSQSAALARVEDESEACKKALLREPRSAACLEREPQKERELYQKYVVRVCCVYPRIDGHSVLELTEAFKELKRLIIREEDLIEEDLDHDSQADVMAFIDQLDEQVLKLKEIIGEAEFLIELNQKLKNTRSKYIASRFRLTVQFLMELGALVGSVTEAVYASLGSTSTAARITGVTLYGINIVLSWINTGFSRFERRDVDTLQNLRRIQAQSAFVRDVMGLVENVKSKRPTVMLREVSPIIAVKPMSPLRSKMEGLRVNAEQTRSLSAKPTCFSIEELSVSRHKLAKLTPKKVEESLVERRVLSFSEMKHEGEGEEGVNVAAVDPHGGISAV